MLDLTTSTHKNQLFLFNILLFLVIDYLRIGSVNAQFKATNLQCLSYDKNLVDFGKCKIQAGNRSTNYVSIHVNLKQVVKSAKVRISVYKRANGWKPFLYDITFDGCKFLRNPKANPLAYFFYNFILEYTNLNHSCPYGHDLYLKNFVISEKNLRLPMPAGDYAVDTQWEINNKMWCRINGSFTVLMSEKHN